MPSFSRSQPDFNYSLSDEIKNLNSWFKHQKVPQPRQNGKLLMASWNVANLGEQKRTTKDLKLIAHLMSRFDLIAVQEIKADYTSFQRIVEYMDGDYDFIISDAGGNNERLGYVYYK